MRCSYTWRTDEPCPSHPGMRNHHCKRQRGHDPHDAPAHECKCGAVTVQPIRKPRTPLEKFA